MQFGPNDLAEESTLASGAPVSSRIACLDAIPIRGEIQPTSTRVGHCGW